MTAAEACQYLSEVGLCAKDYINREVNASLSGGELKRIEIATVLARGTKLSVFDEPEAGIDLWSFARLTETFRQLHDEQKATLVIISHQERIIDLATRSSWWTTASSPSTAPSGDLPNDPGQHRVGLQLYEPG